MSKMITKNGLAVRSIAAQLVQLDIGSKIPRVEDYSKQFGVGRGTIQSALNFLQEEGAVLLEASGHLGTKIVQADKKKLWAMAGLSNILGIMPLPYSKRYEGLATALCEVFEQEDIPFGLAYQRGSGARISGVKNGRYDFAICSGTSAKKAVEDEPELEIAVNLGKSTFVGGHALILRPGMGEQIKDGMRVALDPVSIDQTLMTQRLVGDKNVQYVYKPYNQVIEMFKNDLIDAMIWNSDEFEEKFANLSCVKVEIEEGSEDSGTEAILVCKKENVILKTILREVLIPEKIAEIQKLVMENKKIPKY